jgi:hypothetical protein
MGKKLKLKAMRRIAREMPAMEQNITVGVKVSGKELIEKGVREVQGQPVMGSAKYRAMQKQAFPLNHYRQMKKLYNSDGKAGVGAYINAVAQHQNKQAANG